MDKDFEPKGERKLNGTVSGSVESGISGPCLDWVAADVVLAEVWRTVETTHPGSLLKVPLIVSLTCTGALHWPATSYAVTLRYGHASVIPRSIELEFS